MKRTHGKRAAAIVPGALIGVGAVSLLGAAPVYAQTVAPATDQAAPQTNQQADEAELRAEIAALSARLDKMEQAQATATKNSTLTKNEVAIAPGTPDVAPSVTSGSHLPVTISDLTQVTSLANVAENNKPGTTSVPSYFRLRRNEIRFSAVISPRVLATVMLDPAKYVSVLTTKATVTTPTGTTSAVTSVTPYQAQNPLQDVIISYHVNSDDKWKNFIDVGQMQLPIGYEGPITSSSALETVDRAMMYQIRDPFGGGNGDIRDSGAQLRGSIRQFDYNLGVYNGLGERQNTTAEDGPKAFIGRLIYHVASVPGLQFGLGLARANTGNSPDATTTVTQASRHLLLAHAVYLHDKITFQNEFLAGDLQVNAPGGAGVPNSQIRSYYSNFGYRFRPNLEAVVRGDYFNFDESAPGKTAVQAYTLGLNYFLRGNNSKIQADVVRQIGASGLPAAFSAYNFTTGTSGSNPTTNYLDNRTYFIMQYQAAF